jgi:hypothetical protein
LLGFSAEALNEMSVMVANSAVLIVLMIVASYC